MSADASSKDAKRCQTESSGIESVMRVGIMSVGGVLAVCVVALALHTLLIFA